MGKKNCIAFILLASFCIIKPALAFQAKGPLSCNNTFPLFLMFLNPAPERPFSICESEVKVSADLDYSSVYVNQFKREWFSLMDMETASLGLNMEYGITSDVSVLCRLPFVYMDDGFMDGFLEEFHSTLGLPNYGRGGRPENTFGYALYYKGKKWFNVESGGLHIADSSISTKYSLFKQNNNVPLDIGLSYVLKLPTGDPKYGVGSGQFDHGFFLLTNTNSSTFNIFLNTGYIFMSDPETEGADINVSDIFSAFIGVEYHLSQSISLLTQFSYQTSPIDAPGISQLNNGAAQIDLGVIFSLTEKTYLELSFSEDISGSASPDVIFHFKMSRSFGSV